MESPSHTSPPLFAFAPGTRGPARAALAIILMTAAMHMGTDLLSDLGLELALWQLLMFPLVAFVIWSLRIAGEAISVPVLLTAILLAFLASAFSYLYIRDVPSSFLVAKFQDDEFEAMGRQFRDRLERQLGAVYAARKIGVERSPVVVSSHSEAKDLLNRSQNLPLVLWGGKRWISASSHPDRMRMFDSKPIEPWLAYLPLRLVTFVPVVGLSLEPEPATVEFLISTFAPPIVRGIQAEDLPEPIWLETELLRAATLQAPWSTFAHRALPWWILGNLHFERAFASAPKRSVQGSSAQSEMPTFELGELRCAIDAYTKGRQSLRDGDNPELLAAILNNRAVAQALLATIERDRTLWPVVRRGFKVAAKTMQQKNLYGVQYQAGQIARGNFRTMRKARISSSLSTLREAKKPRARGEARRGSGNKVRAKRMLRLGTNSATTPKQPRRKREGFPRSS